MERQKRKNLKKSKKKELTKPLGKTGSITSGNKSIFVKSFVANAVRYSSQLPFLI